MPSQTKIGYIFVFILVWKQFIIIIIIRVWVINEVGVVGGVIVDWRQAEQQTLVPLQPPECHLCHSPAGADAPPAPAPAPTTE